MRGVSRFLGTALFGAVPGPVSFVICGLVVAGALLTAWLVSRRLRDDDAGTVDDAAGTRIAPETSPPGGISPALAGALLGGGARNYHVMATLVDLAVRGHLRIEAVGPDGWDWLLAKRPEPPADDTLTAYEERVLGQTFARGGGQIRLSSLRDRLRPALAGLHRALNAELAERGWYPRAPHEPSQGLRYAGIAGVLAGAGGGIAGLILGMGGLAVIGAGVAVAGTVLWFASKRAKPRITAAGVAMRERVRAFKQHLADYKSSGAETIGDTFSRYLPYAMVFGLSHTWATVLARTVPGLAGAMSGLTTEDIWLAADLGPEYEFSAVVDSFCDRCVHALPPVAVTDGGSGWGGGSDGFDGHAGDGGGGGGDGGGSW